MSLLDIIIALSVAILWGVNFVAIKLGVMYMPPLTLMALRFLLTAVLLLPWLRLVNRRQWRPIVWIALTMGVGYFCILFIGMHGMSAGESTIIIQVQVPFAAIMAYFVFRERLTWQIIAGTIIAMIGVMVTVGLPQRVSTLDAALLIVIAAIFWAVSANQIRALGKIHPLALNAAYSLLAFPMVLIMAYGFEYRGTIDHFANYFSYWQIYVSLAFMVIVSTIYCYSMWFRLLVRNPVGLVVPFILLEPPVALIVSHFVTGEAVYWHTLLGGLLCIIGLAFVVWRCG